MLTKIHTAYCYNNEEGNNPYIDASIYQRMETEGGLEIHLETCLDVKAEDADESGEDFESILNIYNKEGEEIIKIFGYCHEMWNVIFKTINEYS